MLSRRLMGLFAGLALLTGCSSPAGDEGAAASPAATPEDTTVVLAISQEPTSMLPLMLDVNAGNWRAFEGLLDYDAQLDLEPRLAAEMPTVSEDGLTITVPLREDVTFHDGHPFTAEDVVYTFTTVADPEFGSPILDSWDLRTVLERVEALDDHTVQFTLTRLDPAFLDKLYLGIAPAHLLEGTDATQSALHQEPVGTGPYRWVQTRAGERMVFEAYSDYWGDTPNIDRVVYVFLRDENARVTALRDGSIDAATVPPRLAETFREDDEFQVLQMRTASVQQLTLPTTNPILADQRVRKAFILGLDRERMAETVGLGLARVVDSPLSPDHWAFAGDVSVPHDPAEAARLLDEAGWVDDGSGVRHKDGRPLAITLIHLPQLTSDQELGLAIRSDLAPLGFDITVEGVESDAARERFQTDAWLHGVASAYDPDMDLYSRFHSRYADDDPSTNRQSTRNPEVDAALELARGTLDRQVRAEAYRDVQRLMAEDQSLVHIMDRVVTVVVRADIEGLEPQPMGSPHAFPRGLAWNLERWSLR